MPTPRINKHKELTKRVRTAMEAIARENHTTLALIKAGRGFKMPEWFYTLEDGLDEFGHAEEK